MQMWKNNHAASSLDEMDGLLEAVARSSLYGPKLDIRKLNSLEATKETPVNYP